MMFYRPHETWTTRTDWRTQLPPGEDVTCEYVHSFALALVLTSGSNILERVIYRCHNLQELCPCLHIVRHTVQGLPTKVISNRYMYFMARLYSHNG